MSLKARLSKLEAAQWAARVRQIEGQTYPEILAGMEIDHGPGVEAWMDAYLDGLTEAEQAIIADPDNYKRYPPHPVSQRMLDAWHTWLEERP